MSESEKSGYIFRLFDQPDMAQLTRLLRAYPGTVDEVWFATLPGFATLEAHRAHARRIAGWAATVRELGVTPGLQVANSIGHGGQIVGDDAMAAHFGKLVDLNGAVDGFCVCPRDPAFLDYLEEEARIYAAESATTSMWLDDDLRMNHHGEVRFGCACPRCLAEFAAFQGRTWSREELDRALNGDEQPDLRLRWIEFCCAALAQVAGRAARGAHASGRPVLMGLQECGLEWGTYNGLGMAPVLQAMAAETGAPVGRRPGSGNYLDFAPRGAFGKYLFIAREAADRVACCPMVAAEIENYPHTAMGKSPLGTMVEGLLYLNAGCGALSFVMTSTLNPEPDELVGRQLARLAQWRDLFDALRAVRAAHDCRVEGLNVFRSPHYPARELPAAAERPDGWATQSFGELTDLLPLGVPLSARDGLDAAAVVLTPGSAAAVTPSEWAALKRGGIFLNAAACAVLARRGLIDDWGVTVSEGYAARREELTGGGSFFLAASTGLLQAACPEAWRIYGVVHAQTSGAELGYGTLGRELPEGGRVLISAYAGWSSLLSAAKHRQMLDALDWLVGGRGLAARLLTMSAQAALFPQLDRAGRLRAVTVQNASIDATEALLLNCRTVGVPQRLSWLRPGLAALAVTARTVGDGEFQVELPPLAGWHPGVLLLEYDETAAVSGEEL